MMSSQQYPDRPPREPYRYGETGPIGPTELAAAKRERGLRSAPVLSYSRISYAASLGERLGCSTLLLNLPGWLIWALIFTLLFAQPSRPDDATDARQSPTVAELALPEAPARPGNYSACYSYALDHWSGCDDKRELLDLLCKLLDQHGILTDKALAELTAAVRYESHGNPDARNRRSGCMGELQIHPGHKKRMRKLGLEWNRRGRLDFAVRLYAEQGLRPWACRNKVRRDAAKLVAEKS